MPAERIQILDTLSDDRYRYEMFITYHPQDAGNKYFIGFNLVEFDNTQNRHTEDNNTIKVTLSEDEFERLAANLIKICCERRYARDAD